MKIHNIVRFTRLSGLIITGLFGFVIIALILRDDYRSYESPALLTSFNTIFLTFVSLITAVFAITGYIRLGLWRFLALASGSLVFGFTALLTGPIMRTNGANASITIYNIASLLAAIFYAIAVLRFGSISMTDKFPVKRVLVSSITLILTISIVGIIVLLGIMNVFPPFFAQGTGSTPIREVVLGLVIILMGGTAVNIFRDFIETRTGFSYWFALGLLCIAIGFGGVYIMNTVGSILNWAARSAQYVGNLFLLFAVISSIRKAVSKSSSFDEIVSTVFQDSEFNYRLIMETDPNGIIILNYQGLILSWNRKAENLLGYDRNEVIGSSLSDLIFPHSNDSIDQILKSLQKQPIGEKSSITTDLVAKCKDGSTLPVGFSISGTRTSLGWMGVATLNDITNRKKSEENLKQYAAWLISTNEELESFAYSVSHDLRTPLRTLDSYSELVIMEYGDNLDETGKNYLNRIRKASQTMSQLTEDILKLSGITRAEIHREKVILSELVLSAVDELKQIHPDRQADVIIAPGMTVYGDKSFLQILIRNLLENSWKYTDDNTDIRIEAGYFCQNGENVYFIKDNGIGFDMNFYDKLFEPFQRLHTDKQYSGNGIGLATAKRIIHRHGGKIWAESEIGKGTTFYFTFGKTEDKAHG